MENVKTHNGNFSTGVLIDDLTRQPLESGTYEVNIVVPITSDGAGMLPVKVDELQGECVHEEYGIKVIEEKFLGTLW